MRHIATEHLAILMDKARLENPRGDLYRTLPEDKLFRMLEQNVAELFLAIKYDNDVLDKVADIANYCAFIAHNRQEPPQ